MNHENMAQEPAAPTSVFRSECSLWFGTMSVGLFLAFGKSWLADLSGGVWAASMFAWLFGAMLWLSFSVVRHADCLAIRLGEPYGTLILTLSVISIEVIMIAAVMLTGGDNPTLARDTMFAVLMIVLNGMVGVTLLVGGIKHHEQEYNLQGANAFLSLIIPFAVLALVLPRFTQSTDDASASLPLTLSLIVECAVIYLIFLALQTVRHPAFFIQPGDTNPGHDHRGQVIRTVSFHAVFLVMCMVPIVLLSKNMAQVIDHGIATAGAPVALGGFLVAFLVLAPEGLGALRAAMENQLQRTMNICLGSALATIGLTIPAVLIVGLVTGKTVELGLGDVDTILLLLTLAVSVVNFSSGRTNILQGAIHILLFASYIVMIFD